jgi:hypothetical protein
MDQFKKKKKTQKRLNGQWKLRKEEKEREKKRPEVGKVCIVLSMVLIKKTKFTGDRREKNNLRREEEGKKMFFSTIRALT